MPGLDIGDSFTLCVVEAHTFLKMWKL